MKGNTDDDRLCYECGKMLGRDYRRIMAQGCAVNVHFECVTAVQRREETPSNFISESFERNDTHVCYECDGELGKDYKCIAVFVHYECAGVKRRGERDVQLVEAGFIEKV